MVNVRETKQALQNALVNQDPNRLARIFELPIANSSSSSSSSGQPRKHNPQSFTVDGKDCGGLLTSLLDAHAASEVGNIEAMFEAQIKLHPKFNQLFGSSEGNWMVPAMIVVCKTTHKLGLEADRQILLKSKTKQNHHTKLQKVVPILQESYSKTFNDRTEYQPGAPFDNAGSKQAGVLAIVNELFGMYFRLNILRLCKNLIRPVETKKLSEKGSMSEMVTYRYYIGRLSMFEDDHPRAETNLEYALQHCHKSATSNKKRILKYLVPVKLYRGKLPTTYLLDKYGLEEFKPLVEGIRKGDLRTFQDGLIQYQDRFIRQGTYLLLEKCKTVVYRNLFKRVWKIMDSHQIKLEHIAKAFKWLGMPIDMDEMECILANLIFKRYIKGYLSHAKRTLVLSKRDPFPTSAVISE
mmetsp:Transcript_23184/g.54724  ORF Transcript_23184/g.54724 Transcript_23184/m.54724 type:complete len:409 (-) Transcript_23184:995-2221(-)|eukprot:CAMPEP_0172407620 /NCGR_PEP_ID=MMETSP1061-20121228/75082_1 /TAXON_ID=37318 /ORGANISM="Pseudo-nitzschia pungens, Strain cf. pungens" /LENGTH=408 /DNA_ID=CAMNT_0013143687 /DNA_START=116 /DNA_END=1342 /DNA_ORIENTATION=+